MSGQKVEVLVVGAGQAGIAMSEHLSDCGVPHLVLERDRIAERWRSGRWDSLVANGPAWHDRFPGHGVPDVDPDAFATKEQVADYFVAYAEKIDAPIRSGVEVTSVRRNNGRPGFRVETSDGIIEARYVVAATGAVPAAGHSAGRSRRRRNPSDPLQRVPQSRNSCPTAPCSWSAPDRRGCRSPTNSSSRGGRSTSRSARTTVRRAAIAGATSAGGSEFSASGTRRRLRAAPST